MDKFSTIVSTLPGLPDPSLAIAGCRAGGFGVLNLEYNSFGSKSYENIQKLSRYSQNAFGIKVPAHAEEILNHITSNDFAGLSLIILPYAEPQTLKHALKVLRRRKVRVLLECTSWAEAQAGEQAHFDGIIAKGLEAGGRVGTETTFILLQQILKKISVPVWAQGGIGLHTAAACFAAGAAGIVLDNQLALTRESPLPEAIKNRIASMDGTETLCVGEEIGERFRVGSRLGIPVVKELQKQERRLVKKKIEGKERLSLWRQTVLKHIGWDSPEQHIFTFGQDIAFARTLAERFVTVGGVLQAMEGEISAHWEAARHCRPFAENSPLAQSHQTRYPIVQGPMARVSDTPSFAATVSREGGLPFVAGGRMTGKELHAFLHETRNVPRQNHGGLVSWVFSPVMFTRSKSRR
jgi:Dioxygenases related to 2-nitropropane dioxygenase